MRLNSFIYFYIKKKISIHYTIISVQGFREHIEKKKRIFESIYWPYPIGITKIVRHKISKGLSPIHVFIWNNHANLFLIFVSNSEKSYIEQIICLFNCMCSKLQGKNTPPSLLSDETLIYLFLVLYLTHQDVGLVG